MLWRDWWGTVPWHGMGGVTSGGGGVSSYCKNLSDENCILSTRPDGPVDVGTVYGFVFVATEVAQSGAGWCRSASSDRGLQAWVRDGTPHRAQPDAWRYTPLIMTSRYLNLFHLKIRFVDFYIGTHLDSSVAQANYSNIRLLAGLLAFWLVSWLTIIYLTLLAGHLALLLGHFVCHSCWICSAL